MTKPPTFPIVTAADPGIRPAGKPDACFYCHRKVGEQHAESCVIVVKRVLLRYSFVVEAFVPWS